MPTDPTPAPADEPSFAGAPRPDDAPPRDRQALTTVTATPAAPRAANARFMLSHPWHIVSLGFGSGLSPVAPGTAGTLFAWATFDLLNRYLTVLDWGLLIVAGFFAGVWITGFSAKKLRTDDPSAIVWDEIVSFWLVLLMVTPTSFTGQLWAFVVFRFFDMVKPPPIRYFDRHLKGGFGIMFDDLVAAFFTLLVIALWIMSV